MIHISIFYFSMTLVAILVHCIYNNKFYKDCGNSYVNMAPSKIRSSERVPRDWTLSAMKINLCRGIINGIVRILKKEKSKILLNDLVVITI